MDLVAFFSHPSCTAQRHCEALRAFYHEELPATDAAKKFGLSPSYFEKLHLARSEDAKVAPQLSE